VGGLYVMLNRFGMKRFWRAPCAPLNVVVTGGTKGIGKAIAREFLRWAQAPAWPAHAMLTVCTGVPLHVMCREDCPTCLDAVN
jgi:hypothetical protein